MLTVTIYPVENLVDEVVKRIEAVLLGQEKVRIILAGGSTFVQVYQKLGQLDLPWQRIQFFLGDERVVPLDSKDSNYRMAQESLGEQAQIISWKTDLPPAEALLEYEKSLPVVPFDLVLLGLGKDGHTASLFPAALPEIVKDSLHVAYIETAGLAPFLPRFTLTPSTLVRAKKIIMVATGSSKADILPEIVQDSIGTFPLYHLLKYSAPVELILDQEAAAQLKM